MSFKVAIGGATGNVGSEMARILEQRNFPISEFVPLASAASAALGATVLFRGERHAVRDLATYDFHGTDVLFLSTGATNSREVSPRISATGCVVIDNSSAFRMDEAAPLVVPEVNPQALDDHEWRKRPILPVANCSTIQLVVALKPLDDLARIKRVVVSTYQSAAGGGRRLLERLLREADPVDLDMRALLRDAKLKIAAGGEKPLAFNVVPHIDVFLDDGRTKEEWKMESRRGGSLDDRICPYQRRVFACQ